MRKRNKARIATAMELWALGQELELARRELEKLLVNGFSLSAPEAAAAARRHGRLAARWILVEREHLNFVN